MKKHIYWMLLFCESLVILSLHLSSCTNVKTTIRAINFKNNFTIQVAPSSAANNKGNFFYYYRDYTLLLLKINVDDYGEIRADSNGIYTINSIPKTIIVYDTFVFKKNEVVGVRYKYTYDKKAVLVSKDSIIKRYGRRETRFYQMGNFSLVSTKKLKDETVVQYYASNDDKRPLLYSDSIFCYFSKKLNGIDFSFCKPLDSIMKMKMYRIEYIDDRQFKNMSAEERDLQRIAWEEMTEIKVAHPESIIAICKRFEKDIKNQ